MTKRREFIKTGILGTAGITIGGMGFSSRSYVMLKSLHAIISLKAGK
ncbi:MAG: hypothetical protein NTV31_17585 [Bacteroidia bacterium]|nr:hypothetical protein [Bacteroidia bacterium]